MTTPRFLQVHTLHSYPAALLNRDDSGLAKRLPFGGAVRTRISSQCLKRHWRMAEDEFSLANVAGSAAALRSRNIVELKVIEPLRQAGTHEAGVLDAVAAAFQVGLYGDKGTTETGRQPLLLGLPEVEYLRDKAAAICAEHPQDAAAAKTAAADLFHAKRGEGDNFRAFRATAKLPAGLEGALFGRMVTSDPGANIDAAAHVAHAFTVHCQENENDYFSVVDDLPRGESDPGAAHIGDMELTAGIYYGYAVVDVPGLVSNLEGCAAVDHTAADRTLAAQVIEHLLHLIATVSPGAKLGATAPYAYADLMLVEAGSRQPRSLANAFRDPAEPRVGAAKNKLADYLSQLDRKYGKSEVRRLLSVAETEGEFPGAAQLNLNELAAWAAQAVREGKVA